MANPEQLEILNQGVEVWNKWRCDNPLIMPDLRAADLRRADLREVDLRKAHISEADLREVDFRGAFLSEALFSEANLSKANLRGADLHRARLTRSDLRGARLVKANLRGADLRGARLGEADLSEADLRGAFLREADLGGALLQGADLSRVKILSTIFVDNDLSTVTGLEIVDHQGPSSIGIDSIYLSKGNIPEPFLRGCGVPDEFITFIPSLIGARQALQFYSCFISYSTKDEEFAKRLYSRMRDEHLRVWFAPEDVKGGQKLYEQIERAIQIHDRLLIVLSESSLQSKWVMTEIRRARKVELEENRRKLFPIRLVDYETLQSWECFDADTGEDLAVEVRQYFIPDFSNWKDHDAFEKAFDRLLRDLKAEEKSDSKQ